MTTGTCRWHLKWGRPCGADEPGACVSFGVRMELNNGRTPAGATEHCPVWDTCHTPSVRRAVSAVVAVGQRRESQECPSPPTGCPAPQEAPFLARGQHFDAADLPIPWLWTGEGWSSCDRAARLGRVQGQGTSERLGPDSPQNEAVAKRLCGRPLEPHGPTVRCSQAQVTRVPRCCRVPRSLPPCDQSQGCSPLLFS